MHQAQPRLLHLKRRRPAGIPYPDRTAHLLLRPPEGVAADGKGAWGHPGVGEGRALTSWGAGAGVPFQLWGAQKRSCLQ